MVLAFRNSDTTLFPKPVKIRWSVLYFAIKDLLRAISHFFNDLKDINIILANRLSELYFRCSRGQYVSLSRLGQEMFPHVSGMA